MFAVLFVFAGGFELLAEPVAEDGNIPPNIIHTFEYILEFLLPASVGVSAGYQSQYS